MRRFLTASLAALSLAGISACAGDRVAGQGNPGTIGDAASSPLYDINVLRTQIPESLLQALDAPYTMPKPLTCAEIAAEVRPLDDALGPDLDMEYDKDNPSLIARGHGVAVGALGDAASSLIPLRGWVRKLSGAQQHDRYVQSAIAAGGVRRAFLKGLGQRLNCRSPAAPAPLALTAQPAGAYPAEQQKRFDPKYPIR